MGENQPDGKSVNITFETLFEIATREKTREELQDIPEYFYNDVKKYIEGKKQIMDSSDSSNPFAASEIEKARSQLMSVRRVLKDIYERRERKIITLALNKSRTGSDIIDTSKLLPEEQKMFESLVNEFDGFRKCILSNLVEGKQIIVPKPKQNEPVKPETPAKDEGEEEEDQAPEADSKTKLIRFISPVPKFVGKELEVYGPFEEEDIANLPKEIADVLISKGRAEEV